MNIITLDSCKSTNFSARFYIDHHIDHIDLLENTVIVSRKQTQGRGRSGTWFSPEDCGIYMSVIRRTPAPKGALIEQFTSMVGESITLVLSEHFQLILEKRGINDVYLANRKLAGILCEYHAVADKLIVGVGLNTFRPSNVKIPKYLLDKAVWLNEFSAESLIEHSRLIEIIAEEILHI